MDNTYYASTAYNVQHIPPDMPPQTHKAGALPIYMRIPWGGGKDTTYANGIFTLYSPKHLRKYQGTPYLNSFVGDERYGAINAQVLRPDSIERSSKFWVALYSFGITLPFLALFLSISGTLLFYFMKGSNSGYLIKGYNLFLLQYVVIPSIICFIIGYITVNYIPFLSRRHGAGTKWELNRKTGMVTNFTYGSPGRVILEESVPFYECDAYLWSTPARYGMTHTIVLGHRYSDKIFTLEDMLGRVGVPSSVYEYWDFIQNYMDTSKPLPDIPILEPYRHLDPVTAKHDQQTGRDPHYYLTMDNATWREVKATVGTENINIQERHCLMQQNGVKYFPECQWT